MPESDSLTRLREICLALPETTEKVSWGGDVPTFRVRDKIFVQYEDNHHGSGRVELWCKAPPGTQEVLVGSDPQRFFVPRYVGHAGWIGVWVDAPADWDVIADLVADSCRMTAPKRLAALLDR